MASCVHADTCHRFPSHTIAASSTLRRRLNSLIPQRRGTWLISVRCVVNDSHHLTCLCSLGSPYQFSFYRLFITKGFRRRKSEIFLGSENPRLWCWMFILYPLTPPSYITIAHGFSMLSRRKMLIKFSSRTHRASIPDCFSLPRIKTRNVSICFSIPRCILRAERERFLWTFCSVLGEWVMGKFVPIFLFSFRQNVFEWISILNQESCHSDECLQWFKSFNVFQLPHFLHPRVNTIHLFPSFVSFSVRLLVISLTGVECVLRWLRSTEHRKYSAGISPTMFFFASLSLSSPIHRRFTHR